MAGMNYICPQANQPVPEAEARSWIAEGKGYGVTIAGETGTIEFIAHPGLCASLTLFDRFNRNTWAITWQVAGGSDGECRLAVGSVTASCYADKYQDPRTTPRELRRTILFAFADGTCEAQYTNTGNGFEASAQRTIPCPALPFPAFGDFKPYLMYDYSFFESFAQSLRLKIFPKGPPPRIPSMKAWTSILNPPLESEP